MKKLVLLPLLLLALMAFGQEDAFPSLLYSVSAEPFDIANDSEGNIYYAGEDNAHQEPLESSAILTKYNPDGVMLWTNRITSEIDKFEVITAISINTKDSVIYCIGIFQGDSINFNNPSAWTGTILYADTSTYFYTGANFNYFIVKYNLNGEFLWAKRLGNPEGQFDSGISASTDGVYVCGTFTDSINFNTPSSWNANKLYALGNDFFIAKYNNNGDFMWAKRYGGSTDKFVYDLNVTSENIYLCGSFEDTLNFSDPFQAGVNEIISQGSFDGFLAKFDLEGNVIWARRMGSDDFDYCFNIDVFEDQVYVVGNMDDDCNFNTPAEAFINEIPHLWNTDAYLAKFNNLGEYQWAIAAGSNLDDRVFDVKANASGVYTTGLFYNDLYIQYDSNNDSTKIITAYGGSDMFLYKSNHEGIVKWAKRGGGSSYDKGYALSVFEKSVYVTGEFDDDINFNTPYATGSNEIINFDRSFVVEFVESYAGVEEKSILGEKNGVVYPNPNSGKFKIQLDNSLTIQELNLLDEFGRVIQNLNPKKDSFELNLSKGVYFIEIKTDKSSRIEKIFVN